MYHVAYIEAIDLAISTIQDRFDQPGYACELAAQGYSWEDYSDELQCVCALYTELDASSLKMQLMNLATKFAGNSTTMLHEILDYLCGLSPDARSFFKVCCVASLIIVMPAPNAMSERSFSTMKHIKSYLRSPMKQSRFNHSMVLNIYKEELDILDMVAGLFEQGYV